MIKPVDNRHAMHLYLNTLVFPPLRFFRRTMLARKCHALVSADRYLSRCEEKRNKTRQRLLKTLEKKA